MKVEEAVNVKRKTRSDKKTEIKPTISSDLFETINRIGYITNTPMKVIAETIVMSGLQNRKVIDYISQKFRRDYWYHQTLMKGDSSRLNERTIKFSGPRKRLTLRFQQKEYDKIGELAFALDMTISSTTALLLKGSIQNSQILNRYVASYISRELDPQRIKQLKEVLKYINKNNPYQEEISFTVLISMLYEELVDGTRNFKNTITDWLEEKFQ